MITGGILNLENSVQSLTQVLAWVLKDSFSLSPVWVILGTLSPSPVLLEIISF